ncbi:MAG: hypothetical protein ACREBU_12965, partial [Nitrososphaera sp.]
MSSSTGAQAHCCDARPERFIGVQLKDIRRLAKLAMRISLPLPGRKITYVCHNCGQVWEEHVVPNGGYARMYAVVKAGVDPVWTPEPVGSTPPAYPQSRWFSKQQVLGAGSVLGLVTGLATMSGAGADLAARQGWVASFLLGGFVFAAASYGMLSAARRGGGRPH